jgi:hypothetical protein
MHSQTKTEPAPAESCPMCHTRTVDGVSLYAPDGAAIRPNNGLREDPTVPLTHHPPAANPTPVAGSQPAIQSVQFWQGLSAGLTAAVVALFLIATILAG